jgi:hypothetical protein
LAVAAVISGPALADCNPGQALNAEHAAGAANAQANRADANAARADVRADQRAANGNIGGAVNAQVRSDVAQANAASDEQRARFDNQQAHRDVSGCY